MSIREDGELCLLKFKWIIINILIKYIGIFLLFYPSHQFITYGEHDNLIDSLHEGLREDMDFTF